jgi:hypothetical protein
VRLQKAVLQTAGLPAVLADWPPLLLAPPLIPVAQAETLQPAVAVAVAVRLAIKTELAAPVALEAITAATRAVAVAVAALLAPSNTTDRQAVTVLVVPVAQVI